MQSVVNRLGELQHICDKANLKLRTNACITLSFPQSYDHDLSSKVQIIDGLISSGTWANGLNRLRLHCEFSFDDIVVSGSDLSQTTEDIGVVLCNAEVP